MKKIALFLCLFLFSCSLNQYKQVKQHDYCDVDAQISWSDVFNQCEDQYLVYFYSESCGYCQTIKNDVIEYYLSKKEAMYFVDSGGEDAKFGPVKDLTGIFDIESFYIFGTPFLIKTKEKKIDSYYAGMNQILEYIRS